MKIIIGRYQIELIRTPTKELTFACEACNEPGQCVKHDQTSDGYLGDREQLCDPTFFCNGHCAECVQARRGASEPTALIIRKAA